jgi:hypothetical protein
MHRAARLIVPLLGAALAAAAGRDTREEDASHMLRAIGGFDAGELAALSRGESVAKLLDTDKREIAVVGAVRIKARYARLFDAYRDVSRLRNSRVVQEAGSFGRMPAADDLRDLTFEDYDLQTIRDCRPGDCGVRLPDGAMERLQREVDWSAGDWRQQASGLWRRLLADYVGRYAANGHAALAEYHNKAVPLKVPEEFAILFGEADPLREAAPAFLAYLQTFPRTHLDGAEDHFYWTKEDFGLRPVVSLTHLTLYAPRAPGDRAQPTALIATQRFYATHYFDAAFGVTLVIEDGPSAFYMLALDRARTRSLTSFSRALVRGIVQRRSRDALEKILQSTRADLERAATSAAR